MVIPIENSFLYVEPVFLLADGVDIPQLQRVIVAIGDNIAMQPTIEQAMFELFGDDAGFMLPPAASILPTDPEAPIPADEDGEIMVDRAYSMELENIRTTWRDLLQALEEGNWTRYGELLQELDSQINDD